MTTRREMMTTRAATANVRKTGKAFLGTLERFLKTLKAPLTRGTLRTAMEKPDVKYQEFETAIFDLFHALNDDELG